MKHIRMLMIGAAMVAAIGPVAAQDAGGPIEPGVYTIDNVHPMGPFRSPNIDPATVDLANIGLTLDPLNDAELLEVRQRCSVIVGSPEREGAVLMMPYTPETVAFCEAVFEWVAANRPNAPDTDEELAAMPAPAQ